MRQEMTAGYDPPADDDDLAPLLDVKFILLIALMVVLTFFSQQEFDNRFAVPAGPGPGLIALDEQDYRRMAVVSLDRDGRLGVNGQPVTEAQLADRLQAALQAEGDRPQVVFNADPAIPHGDAERVYLRLLRHGFTVLEEYREIDDES